MKRMYLGFGAAVLVILGSMAAAQTSSQETSLGSYARGVRKQGQGQKAADSKHYDNDNLPQNEKISVVGPTPVAEAASNANGDAPKSDGDAAKTNGGAAAGAGDAAASADGAKKDDGSADSKQAANAEWQSKIADQKKQIDLASRELDVLQREYQLRAAAMYADAGNRLRNAGAWDKEDSDYKQKIADKQKAVDAAKQKLDDMQEQARKAGVPSSMRE
jgi:hypothetical protein